MALTVKFELTTDRLRELLQMPTGGLFGGLWRKLMANAAERLASQLVGTNEVEVSEAGVRQSRDAVVRTWSWAQVASVNERPLSWAFQMKPSGVVVIPRDAVPEAEAAAFSTELKALSGQRYRVRAK